MKVELDALNFFNIPNVKAYSNNMQQKLGQLLYLPIIPLFHVIISLVYAGPLLA